MFQVAINSRCTKPATALVITAVGRRTSPPSGPSTALWSYSRRRSMPFAKHFLTGVTPHSAEQLLYAQPMHNTNAIQRILSYPARDLPRHREDSPPSATMHTRLQTSSADVPLPLSPSKSPETMPIDYAEFLSDYSKTWVPNPSTYRRTLRFMLCAVSAMI